MVSISERPPHAYQPELASQLLGVAKSYLDHAEHLIYSFGGKTFLAGYDLYDRENGGRGNIDCSTFVLMVLAGIPYEKSPYVNGHTKNLTLNPFIEMDFSCFYNIPDKYITIADRIGRPYLNCPKGLDLEKAAAMGLSREQLVAEIKAAGEGGHTRRSVDLAKHFVNRRLCFTDEAYLQPGDLVFYQSKKFFGEADYKPQDLTEVTHVGIVGQDTRFMINSSGYLDKKRAELEKKAAVSVEPVWGKREPVYYARPVYCEKE